jgi:hypothetical protein
MNSAALLSTGAHSPLLMSQFSHELSAASAAKLAAIQAHKFKSKGMNSSSSQNIHLLPDCKSNLI